MFRVQIWRQLWLCWHQLTGKISVLVTPYRFVPRGHFQITTGSFSCTVVRQKCPGTSLTGSWNARGSRHWRSWSNRMYHFVSDVCWNLVWNSLPLCLIKFLILLKNNILTGACWFFLLNCNFMIPLTSSNCRK